MKLRLFLSIFLFLFTSNISAQAIMDTKFGNNADPTNLSDKDKDLSDNFIHDERVQRIYEEECTANSETEEACLGNKADKKFMGMKASMVGALSKAYAMFMGTAGGDLEKGPPDTAKEGADSAESSSDEEGQTDYCKYIPVATEAISMFNTQTEQKSINNLPTKEDTQQRDSLLKAAANHDSRAKTAKIQTAGWGAGTACYVTSLTFSGATWKSWKNVSKLAASTLLTGFYMSQIGAHEEYADKTRAIAAKLPNKGDCNPITDKLCFCTEPTSKKRVDYKQYCQPQLSNKKIASTSERMTCIDDKMKEDPACKCAVTDSCVDKKIMTTISGINGQALLSSPSLKEFSSMARGELTSKSLTNAQASLNNALAKLKEIDKKVEPEENIILTKSQKAEVGILEDMGMPANIAQRIATTPLSAEAKKNMAKFQGSLNNSRRNYSNYKSNRKKKGSVLSFSRGDGINSNNQKSKKEKPDFMARFNQKKKRRAKSNKAVLRFAQQAENKAQISRNIDRPIFDIISRRYQVSGWRRLEYIK